MRFLYVLLVFLFYQASPIKAQWTYINIDSTKQKWGDWAEPNWLRYFGLASIDVNRDGCTDIVSGRYIYKNPCADMQAHWPRITLDDNVDAILTMDVDGDPYADIIAQALPNVYWYEASDQEGTTYVRRKIAEVPATSHVNSQGFAVGQLIKGGPEEIVVAGSGNIYCIEVPETPNSVSPWPTTLIGQNTSDEGIGIGDVNDDGLQDIAAGRRASGEDEPTILVWFENPGRVDSNWADHIIGQTKHPIDRVALADINRDGKNDVVITEERYPGLEPDASLYWFEQSNNISQPWHQHEVVTQYSMNNLDLADIDSDGDIDILTNEHKGPNLELQWWLNDGQGIFKKKTIDTGKENHLGTQLVDLDNDGDLDIIGAAWDNYKHMHVWRNDHSTSYMLPDKPFREFHWQPASITKSEQFLRVGGKLDYRENQDQVAAHQLVNSNISFPEHLDLTNSIDAELWIERVQSHEDSKDLSISWNGHDLIPIPIPATLPDNGENYMFHHQARVSLPLHHLVEGSGNTFQFDIGEDQAWDWPQNLVYGLVLRIYYDTESPNEQVLHEIHSNHVGCSVSNVANEISAVEFLALYEDYDLSGDGIFRKWHESYHQGNYSTSLGRVDSAPFEYTWDLSKVPQQNLPIRLAARLHFRDGSLKYTQSENFSLADQSLALVKPFKVPSHWVTRGGVHTQHLYLDYEVKNGAELCYRSWSPCYNHGILVNRQTVVQATPEDPCYSYNIHLESFKSSDLKVGLNHITTNMTPLYDGQMVHGMEVQWPGIAVKAEKVSSPVNIVETIYEGRKHFLIRTKTATYYFDIKGGGLSRIIDPHGNDWIQFKISPSESYPAAAAGAFRGLPNLVYQSSEGGAGHPGFDQCNTIVSGHNELLTTSLSGTWQWRWTFNDTHASCLVEKVAEDHPYWFLYEGTPGGTFNPELAYYGTDQQGPISRTPDFYSGDVFTGQIRWAYFGQKNQELIFYLAQVNLDSELDILSYLGNDEVKGLDSSDGMTVFGFGRGSDTKPLLTTPQSFIIGLYPHPITGLQDHEVFSDFISDYLE